MAAQGGIEKYLLQHPDGGHWVGKNFTFDNRGESAAQSADHGVAAVSRCVTCDTPWSTYLGKHKCTACLVPLLVCDGCLSKGVHRDETLRDARRCRLCKEQGRTADNFTPAMVHNGTAHGKQQRPAPGQPSKKRRGGGGGRGGKRSRK